MKKIKKLSTLLLAAVMTIGYIPANAEYPEALVENPTEFVDMGRNNIVGDKWVDKLDATQPVPYTFSIDGSKNYILLDKDVDGNYLIATSTYTNRFDFDTNYSNGWDYDPTQADNIAYKINNSYVTGPFASAIMADYAVEKTWKTEAALAQSIPERTFNARFVIPSYTEWFTYQDKLYWGNYHNTGFTIPKVLRTPSNIAEIDYTAKHYTLGWNDDAFEAIDLDLKADGYGAFYAPVFFWVKSDLFKENAVTSAGTQVIEQLKNDLSIMDLLEVYGEEQLESLFSIELGEEGSAVISSFKLSCDIPDVGEDVSITYNSDKEIDETKSQILWYAASQADGEYSVLLGVSGASIKIPNEAKGKYIKAGIIPITSDDKVGEIYYSEPLKVNVGLYDNPTQFTDRGRQNAWGDKWVDKLDSSEPVPYTFSIDGNINYILLDKDKDGNYLIATSKDTNRFAFDTNTSNGWDYNPAQEDNIGYKINNQYVTTAVFASEGLANYVVEKTWKTEAAPAQNIPERTFNAKFVIPSYTEWLTYQDKLYWKNYINMGFRIHITLRTPANITGLDYESKKYSLGWADEEFVGVDINNGVADNTLYAPIFFWVNDDFFKENAVVTTSAGTKVIEQLKADLSPVDLLALYTQDELTNVFDVQFGGDGSAVITNAKVKCEDNVPGAEIAFTYNSDKVLNTDYSTISWQVADTANGAYTDISGLKGEAVTIPSAAGGKYLRAAFLPVTEDNKIGNYVYSNAVLIEESLDTYGYTANFCETNFVENTAATAYEFQIAENGKKYTVLNTNEDGSDFLVLANFHSVGEYCFVGFPSINMKPDAQTDNLAGFLNDSYMNVTENYKDPDSTYARVVTSLDTQLVKYIKKDTMWRTEASAAGDEYVFKAAITLPSVTELIKYGEKIGRNYAGNWWTRTASKDYADKAMIIIPNGVMDSAQTTSLGCIRPIFRLDREFFVETKLPLNTMGAEIKELLTENFARSELSGIYSETELTEIGFRADVVEPEVRNLVISGSLAAANIVNASYKYYSADESDISSVDYLWYISEDGVSFDKVEGATEASFQLPTDAVGKYVRVGVRVTNQAGVNSKFYYFTTATTVKPQEPITVTNKSLTKTEKGAVAEFTFNNISSSEPTMNIIIAVYKKQGNVFKHAKIQPVTVKKGINVYGAEMDDFTMSDEYYVKAMVWDSIDGMKPYCLAE